MDFIFIIGPSAVGKTTLAKSLYQHYKGVYFEQNMVPEFVVPKGVGDIGIYEEQLCWDNVLLQLKFFYDKGHRNIVALDFDDIRTRELPFIFKGYKFITLKLVSSDPKQIKEQMINRHNNEGGLYAPDYVERSNYVIMHRNLLPNEVQIDVAGKTKEDVLNEAINIIDDFEPKTDYVYELDDEHNYLSWVQSRQLF
ncbi:MAG: AAA family ATPase [Lachnospiraceae bacterium]|nr:AAA family ATPase [Lachnospiraceae bacterium]